MTDMARVYNLAAQRLSRLRVDLLRELTYAERTRDKLELARQASMARRWAAELKTAALFGVAVREW